MLANIRVVLINTFHPGNIGSAARAMKTMGLDHLYLVKPQSFPSSEATALSAGASDVLNKAIVVESLDEAIAECTIIIGTSARSRNRVSSRPLLNAQECANKILPISQTCQVALVFGQETMGMTNEELEKCHYHACIDANPLYPVLNIASAIQIFCYELYKTHQESINDNANKKIDDYVINLALSNDVEGFYQHLEKVLTLLDFLNEKKSGRVLERLRRLFTRSQLEVNEVKILRGILTSIEKNMNIPKKE